MVKLDTLFSGLVVNVEQMKTTIAKAGSATMAESVLLTLVSKGMGRQDAHELIRRCSMEAQKAGEDFKTRLMKTKEVTSLLSEKEVDAALDPKAYLGSTGKTIDNILRIVSSGK